MQLMLAALLVGMPGPGDALVDWIVTPSYAMCITPKIGSSMFLEYARWVALDDATVRNFTIFSPHPRNPRVGVGPAPARPTAKVDRIIG